MLTKDSICTCSVLCVTSNGISDSTLTCGSDINVGCTLNYSFPADRGGYYIAYDSNGILLEECTVGPAALSGTRGGGFVVYPACSYFVFGPTVTVHKTVDICIGDLIDGCDSLEELCSSLATFNFNDDDSQQVINLYLSGGGDGGGDGDGDGATFIPSVDADGNLSWTNDKGLENPEPVNIKGSQGTDGKDGTSVTHSWDGTTLTVTSASGTSSANLKGDKGDSIKGDQGNPGADGKDGTSVTHSWDGTTLTVTSASGTSSANLKGDKGDKGDSIKGDQGNPGADGRRGTGILKVTTAPSSYTTAIGEYTPKYRIALSTVTSQSGVSEVLVGDVIQYSYYQYLVSYLDATYAYISATRASLRGATGAAGAAGADGYTPVRGTDYWTAADKAEIVDDAAGVLIAEYGAVFKTFPTRAEIEALPNNSYFTVMADGGVNKENRVATYYYTKSWTRNALEYKDAAGNIEFYVVPVNQPVGDLYLPYYGIKTGETNAESNSAILSALLSVCNMGVTFTLPVGHFYFSEPIDLASKQISMVGTVNASFKNPDMFGTTWLYFPSLEDGESALIVSQGTIADFTIVGSSDSYNLKLTRNKAFTDVGTVVSETHNLTTYGITASGTTNIRNIGVQYFYCGCWCETSNLAIENLMINNCHYGLSIECDAKVRNLFGFDVMTLLQIRDSICSAVGVRGDSIGKHLVEILKGSGTSLVDLDADFCMDSIVAIGDGTNSSTVSDLSIINVHGRSGVRHFYKIGESEVTANDVTADNYGEFGVVAIKKGASLNGAIIVTNQYSASPFDGSDYNTYRTPFVLLSAGQNTVAKGIQILSTSYSGNELTEDWVKKRIASVSSVADACDIRVQTACGSVKYRKTNGVLTIIDDATDIYRRMDKSALAFDAEVVKSVNGCFPDEAGNVVVEEVEPEVVGSADDFTDTTKKYVLPDGYIYAYRRRFIPGSTTANFTNQLPISLAPALDGTVYNGTGYKYNTVLKLSSKVFSEVASTYNLYTTGLIPVKIGDVIRVNCMGTHQGALNASMPAIMVIRKDLSNKAAFYYGNLSTIQNGGGSYVLSGANADVKISDLVMNVNKDTLDWVANAEIGYAIFTIWGSTPPDDVIITVNEEITYTVTEDRYEWSWENTGELYVQPDYLGMIAELEARIIALENK